MSDIEEMKKPRVELTQSSDSETESISSDSKSSHSGTEEEESDYSDSENSSDDESSGDESGSDDEEEIDLSDNEIYKGMYSFFEDEEGHNILDYISLLHTELIGMNKTLLNVKLIRKDMTRIADAVEALVSLNQSEMEEKRQRRNK
jgi:hypothetical protein